MAEPSGRPLDCGTRHPASGGAAVASGHSGRFPGGQTRQQEPQRRLSSFHSDSSSCCASLRQSMARYRIRQSPICGLSRIGLRARLAERRKKPGPTNYMLTCARMSQQTRAPKGGGPLQGGRIVPLKYPRSPKLRFVSPAGGPELTLASLYRPRSPPPESFLCSRASVSCSYPRASPVPAHSP